MNAIERVAEAIRKRLPEATVEVDSADPATVTKFPNAPWFFHVRLKGKFLPCEWRPDRGFGFGDDDESYGEHPSTVLTDERAVVEYVVKRLA